jgi:hypothetical protein
MPTKPVMSAKRMEASEKPSAMLSPGADLRRSTTLSGRTLRKTCSVSALAFSAKPKA